MSIDDLFTRETWEQCCLGLRGTAKSWWKEHHDVFVGMARDDVEAIMRRLRHGDVTQAKLYLASRMTADEFDAWQDETIARLTTLAQQRARMLTALEDLGERAARLLGIVVLTALGGPKL